MATHIAFLPGRYELPAPACLVSLSGRMSVFYNSTIQQFNNSNNSNNHFPVGRRILRVLTVTLFVVLDIIYFRNLITFAPIDTNATPHRAKK